MYPAAPFLLSPQPPKKIQFLDIGLGYIQMAGSDPHLYDLLYLTGAVKPDHWLFPEKQDYILAAMAEDPLLSLLNREKRIEILTHMSVYTHGLVMLGRADPELSPDILESQLEEMGRIVISNTLKEEGIPDHENPCLKRQP